tara:strand:- start:428 stop:769 length:342 start_codon:yes stop_codon:yes gene_type:complete
MLLLFVPHVFLQKEHAKQFLGKFKPQLVAGNVLSSCGLNEYTKARIALENTRCSGALVRMDDEVCLFVINIEGNATIVTASVFTSPPRAPEASEDLKKWHEITFPDSVLSFNY